MNRPIGIQTIPFDGYAELLRKMATKARMHLEGPKSHEIIAVIGLLDLYGPTFYPQDQTTADVRFAWAKQHFEREVGLDKFRLFFAVHEFEAWLLSQPQIFPRDVKDALPAKICQPEKVNFDEPPAKLLNRIYESKLRHNYKKTTYGKQLFAKLDPTVAIEKCPYLKVMLEAMLKMAKDAGL